MIVFAAEVVGDGVERRERGGESMMKGLGRKKGRGRRLQAATTVSTHGRQTFGRSDLVSVRILP